MQEKILGNRKKGLLFIISAPAGTGKNTLVNMLIKEFPLAVVESCSATTRLPRPLEVQGKDYDFMSVQEFEHRLDAGEFLEHAKVFGTYYGTRKQEVERLEASGQHVFLVIDTQGALQIKQQRQAVLIFISPPTREELRLRLFRRNTEDEATIQQRLDWAEKEMEMIPHYDYHIVNDNLELSYQVLRGIVIAEAHRVREIEGSSYHW